MKSLRLFIVFMFAPLFACGGGTSGTGPTGDNSAMSRIIQGTVVSSVNQAVENVSVELLETGEQVLTDRLGRFTLVAPEEKAKLKLSVETDEASSIFELTAIAKNSSIIGVKVELDEENLGISSFELSITSIGGEECEGAFNAPKTLSFDSDTSPLLIYDQTKIIPKSAKCTIAVSVFVNEAPAVNSGFQVLEIAPLPEKKDKHKFQNRQRVVAQSQTDEDGKGKISFTLSRFDSNNGFFLLEAPLELYQKDRVGIVINPLKDIDDWGV